MIYITVENDILLAGYMIKKDTEYGWEMYKLCSNKSEQKIYIISNSKLNEALHIYKKFGFKEIKLNDYHYKRGDIAFEFVPGRL